MSRVPEKTREFFVSLANEEFCGDYGLCLKAILDGYSMWKLFLENTNMKLDLIYEKLDSLSNLVGKEKINEEIKEGIKTLSGNIITRR